MCRWWGGGGETCSGGAENQASFLPLKRLRELPAAIGVRTRLHFQHPARAKVRPSCIHARSRCTRRAPICVSMKDVKEPSTCYSRAWFQ